MSLEDLVREVRDRTERELQAILTRSEQERAEISRQAEQEISHINELEETESAHEVEVESNRTRAEARLQARKVLDEAKERRIQEGRLLLNQRLKAFTSTPEYFQMLQRMADAAIAVLGEDTRLVVRKEDAQQLPPYLSIRMLKGRNLTAMGGLVAETSDGKRRISMTFEDLLRWKEDRITEILARQ